MPVKKSSQKRVYQFRVTLSDLRPPIWRSLQVTSDTTLRELHRILQTVIGWSNSHLHEFFVNGDVYRNAEAMEEEVLDAKTVRLDQLIAEEEARFFYEYDPIDEWEHEILVEKILSQEKGIRYPLCLAGERACPLENCGGPIGYEDLLEALMDPSHPEHEEKFAWLPGDFDSEKFDAKLVNQQLRGSQRCGDPFRNM